jgi:hypothetical protein
MPRLKTQNISTNQFNIPPKQEQRDNCSRLSILDNYTRYIHRDLLNFADDLAGADPIPGDEQNMDRTWNHIQIFRFVLFNSLG